MNRKYAMIAAILSGLLLASLIAAVEYPKLKKLENRGPAYQRVAAELPGDINQVASVIGDTFNVWADLDRPGGVGNFQNKFPYGSHWSHFFLFRKDDPQHPSFPSDEEILRDRGVDSFVDRYVRIPAELRSRDFYLYEPTGDHYWESEYFYKGKVAKFRCSFLIHLEPAENSRTRIEIFEYQPTVWIGEYWGMSAHAILPTMLHDIRPVQPTTSDRKEVLRLIQQSLTSSRPTATIRVECGSLFTLSFKGLPPFAVRAFPDVLQPCHSRRISLRAPEFRELPSRGPRRSIA